MIDILLNVLRGSIIASADPKIRENALSLDGECQSNGLRCDVGDLNMLGEALRQVPQITQLTWVTACIDQWGLDKIRAFVRGLQGTNIRTLDLTYNDLGRWSLWQIRVFVEELQHTNITALCLNNNELFRWNVWDIRAFFEGLEDTQIHTLWLEGNNHRQNGSFDPTDPNYYLPEEVVLWNVPEIKAFMHGIRNSNIETLNLNKGYLDYWDVPRIEALVKGLQGSNITSLYLDWNDFHRWSVEKIRVFMQGLEGTQIIRLTLRGARLDDCNEEQICAFAQGVRDSNITMIVSDVTSWERIHDPEDCIIIRMISEVIAHINSVEVGDMTDDLDGAIECLDELLSLLRLLGAGTDRLDNLHIPQIINDGYTAILAMLWRHEKNFALFVKYLDKIACISDNNFAFHFANFLALEPNTKPKLLFYRLVEKVNLGDEGLRSFYQGMLTDKIHGSSPEAVLMTADGIRDEAARQLLELLEEGLYAGDNVDIIENYCSDSLVCEEKKEEKLIEIEVDHRGLGGRNLEEEAENYVQGSSENTWEFGDEDFELSVMGISILNSAKRVTIEGDGDTKNEFKICSNGEILYGDEERAECHQPSNT